LARNEWEICDFGDGHVVTEPVFAADPDDPQEGSGWLLTTVFDPIKDESGLAVIDARHINDGPICTAALGVNAGYSFHGFFDARA
jgi:carotenoid cleavage dioxygenase-like enzyme